MPQFIPSATKTAKAPITVKPSGLSCQAELYLVSNGAKVVTSGVKAFTSTGGKQDIIFPITMPDSVGTFPVWLDVFAEGLPIGAYKAIEDVVITIPTPHFVSINLPSTSPGGEFSPTIVVFLPKAYLTNYPVYRVSLIIDEGELPEDNRGPAELVSVEYTLEDLAECANSILGAGQYRPLDSVDNKYTITGTKGWIGTRYDFVPCRAVYYATGYVWKDLPVGSYPVRGLIWYWGFACSKATGDVTYGPPSGAIDFGILAVLEVR